MKVSAFARPDPGTPNSQLHNSQVGRRGSWEWYLAAAYVAAHLPFVAPSLEDIDSINFALGLHDFDPARHQPHPPGSPVYIALGRALLPFVSSDALALGLLSVVAAAIAIIAAAHVFTELEESDVGNVRAAIWAPALMAVSPLFWMSGLRPMSDAPGLALALVAQALALKGRTDRRRLVQAAVVSALAAGIRVQTILLTVPVLAIMLIVQRRQGWRWIMSRPVAAFAAGVLVWAVPLVADSGGMAGYIRALGTQAGEDFAWVTMLWLEPAPRRLAFALYETFALPWASVPLAVAMTVAATVGGLVMIARGRPSLLMLMVAFAPYALFHLLFQETLTVRYALPLVPPVAFLAARGLTAAGRFAPIVMVPALAASLLVAVPAAVAYGSEPHPAFRAIADASRRADPDAPAAVYSHFSLRRALQASPGPWRFEEPRPQFEWLAPVEYWKSGGTAPIWFFADPRRTDLALIDPQSRLDVARYQWAVARRPELGGSRPLGADWYRLSPPGWFAGEGWSLTPETGGLARATARGPDHAPIEAWIRRRPGPVHLVVGGRHLGEPGDPDAAFELAVDGVVRDRWTLTVGQPNFLRFLDLREGIAAGEGEYALLTIASHSPAGDARRAASSVRQFDFQSAHEMIYGYGEGWYEEESDPPTGGRWRWTSEKSVLRVKGPPQAVRVTVRGESPLRYFDAPPTVRVTAAGRVIGQFQPTADFEWSVTVAAEDVFRANGAIAIETDRVYLPAVVEGSSDQRHLGLRLFETRVDPVRRDR